MCAREPPARVTWHCATTSEQRSLVHAARYTSSESVSRSIWDKVRRFRARASAETLRVARTERAQSRGAILLFVTAAPAAVAAALSLRRVRSFVLPRAFANCSRYVDGTSPARESVSRRGRARARALLSGITILRLPPCASYVLLYMQILEDDRSEKHRCNFRASVSLCLSRTAMPRADFENRHPSATRSRFLCRYASVNSARRNWETVYVRWKRQT